MGQIRVDLMFQADTSAAITNIQQLGQLLQSIGTTTHIGVDNGPLQQAVQSAQQLQVHLQNAVNVNTGKLDLTKLSASLKSAGTDLQTLTNNLQAAGPAGQQAFLKVATAVASAEAPMIRVNQRLKDFGTTLLNTIKWQLASSAIHAVSGMLSSAVRHAEELNVALNDIRIVTGKSSSEMAHFAAEANAAAKALSTTSTEYARAALIFYQQGLDGSQVTDRADVVVKLAQVTGQSMETVSSQMTAIWNNFYEKGGPSLEYYADVLTKLGAATAASTDEISDGLEKFAAVADTVGLSYEYAAAAVATVVDKTRQSAEVVGTAFKTIFARMEGLSLGETLEDGTDLNKYSEALATVGVNIKTADGELKTMDTILNELGEKWQLLGQDTKIALAQTVGGMRQYNQFLALMENWEGPTGVLANIEKAKQATGELTVQQKIWSESYTAAAERVKQAQNELYESFINDEAITGLTDIFASMISSFSTFIDSIGGAVPFVLMLIGLFSKSLFPMIQSGITRLGNMFSVWTGKAAQDIRNMQATMSDSLGSMMNQAGLTEGQKQQIVLTQGLLDAKRALTAASKNMSVAEQEEAQRRMANYEALVSETQKTLEHKAALEQEIELLKQKMNTGSAKMDIAKQSVTTAYRAENEGNTSIDTEAVISDATSSTIGQTKAEMEQLKQNASERAAIEEQIKRTQQSINSYTSEYAGLSNTNTKHAQDILDKCTAQEQKLAELKKRAEELGTEDEERKKHLEEVLKVQERIVQASQGEMKDMVVGQASTSAFSDNEYSRGGEVAQMETAMTDDVMSQMGGSMDDMGNMVVDASLANLEKLFGVMGQYKQQLAEITALENDFKAAKNEVAVADSEVAAAETELGEATQRVANIKKKMQGLSKDEKKNTKLMASLTRELEDAQADLSKADTKRQKALAKSEKAQKKYSKTLSKSKDSIMSLAKAAKMPQAELDKLEQDFKDLEAGGTKGQAALKNITGVLSNLKTATMDTDSSLDMLSQSMQQTLLGAGINPQQLNALVAKLQELGIITPDVANKIRMVGNAGDEMNNKLSASQQRFMGVASGIASAAGQITMAIGAIRSMISAFDEGNTPLETFSGLMMGISMILPMIIGLTTKMAASEGLANAAKAMGIKVTASQMAAENAHGLARVALTIKTWLQTAAEVALKIAQNPVLGAVILAGIVAATVAIGVMTNNTKSATEAQKEKNAADMEGAEAANKLSEAWADATTAMDTAIAKYKELTEAGKDTKDSIQGIIDAIPDLVQSYRDAAASMSGLTDEQRTQINETADYIERQKELLKVAKDPETQQQIINNINEAQAKNDNVISENAAEEAQKGATAAMSQTAQAIVDVGDAKWEDGKVKRHVGGAGTQKRKDYGVKDANGKTVKLNEEEASVDILMQAFGQGRNVDRKNGFDVSLSTGSSEDFLADYEKLMEAATQMENQLGDQLDNSDTYREVKDMLNGSKEQYEKLKEMQAEADKYGVFDAKSNLEAKTFESSGEKMAVENISSMEEYKKYKEALLSDENVQDPAAQEIAKQWLESNAALEKYVAAEKRIEGIRDNAGDAVAEDLYKMVDKLDDEQTALFLEVDVNKYQTEAAIMSEIERLQGVADQEEIQLKIEAINNAQSALKESGMTQEDWTTIKDSGIDWGNEEAGIMEFTDFLKMSYSEQQAYLQQMETAQNEELIKSTEATKAALEENLKNLDKNSATYAQDKALIEEQIQAEEERLAIIEKTAKAQMWEDQGLNAGEVEEYASALEELPLVETREEAEAIAAANMRMNKGIDALAEGWEEWGAALKSGNKSSQEYAAALKGVKTAVADVLDTDTDQFTDDFLTSAETLGLLEKVAQGDMEALAELQQQAALNVTGQIKIDTNQTELQGQLDSINSWITDFPDLEIGASLDSTGMTAAFQALLDSGAMTVDQMNAILNNIGFEPEITYKEMTVAEAKAAKQTAYLKTDTGEYTQVTDEVKLQDDAKVWVPVINGKNTSYQGPPKTSLNQKKDGGGGGGDKKKADKAKKSDTVERYKEVTDALDDNADAMDKASRAADRLYGKDRLAKMREANKLLQKEIDLTKQKKKEAEDYLKIDKAELDAMAAEAGVSFTYDSKGNISNYEEEMTKLFNELDSAINRANADGNADENEQKEIDAIQEKIDKVKDAMSTYEDTRELIEDLDTELEEKLHEWQDANFDILNTELELKIEINDMDLQRLEYYLGKMEDDFYQMAEAAALMVMNAEGNGFGGQLTSYMDQLQHQEDYLEKLHKQYAAGEISQANYIEGLKNASSAIYEQLGNLQELDSTMMEYYSETLAAAGEEIAKYTELMENASGVLDHYASIAEMLGKSTDYKYMGKILQAQADVASNAYKVSKANYEMLKKQEDERKQAYDDAVARNASESELEMLEKQWWDARTAANEAQDTMLSDVETWAEALRAVLDNSIADFGQELENTLTAGYGSFDAMTSAFERKNALQEEYLTTTNKIYETNKMMRTAQQEIDKTTNEAAKRRLKQFINETDALQDQTKLSQYELDIQQAKYDLLLAEIALEEAQNAKSTVRLQRDNEGNMSYVYTADQNKIADAQQKVEDAQNALYNKGLEGANDYVQKYQETMQEMYDTLTEIQQNYLDGAYESEEEYNNAIEEAKEYYYEKLTQYSNLYQVALTTDTRVAADAWTTEFASMTENTEDWMTAVNGYVGDVQGAFATWKSQMDTIEQETLGNMDETLSNIVSDSEDLAETVTDEVVPALEKEMEAVKDVTDKYATFRETLESITKEYEAMAKAAEDAVKAANGLEDGTNTGGPGDGSGDKDNNNNNNNNNNDDKDEKNGNGNSSTLTWDRVKAVYNAINGGKWGTGSDRKKNGKAAGYTDEEIAKGQELINKVYGGMSLAAAKTALGFASGGYTGDWTGAYGKLAFLHQKELILNQHDTENFLASMEILERILQMIDLQATSAQLGGILSTPKFTHSNESILEQNVHIEASFPGVTDHNEVELAMTNLINTASQYANRK